MGDDILKQQNRTAENLQEARDRLICQLEQTGGAERAELQEAVMLLWSVAQSGVVLGRNIRLCELAKENFVSDLNLAENGRYLEDLDELRERPGRLIAPSSTPTVSCAGY